MIPARPVRRRPPRGHARGSARIYFPHGAIMPKWTPATEGAGLRADARSCSRSNRSTTRSTSSAISSTRSRTAAAQRRTTIARRPRILSGAFAEDRRPAVARHHRRSDRRAEDRSGHAAAIARADDRGAEPELRRRPELLLSRHDFLAGPARAAADAEQPAGRLRAAVRRRQHRASSARRGAQQSISLLDSVLGEASTLQRKLPASDRTRLDQYLTDVREIERRVQKAGQQLSDDLPVPAAPTGVPTRRRGAHQADVRPAGAGVAGGDHARLDVPDVQGAEHAVYPKSGVRDAFHTLSHHSNVPDNIRTASRS